LKIFGDKNVIRRNARLTGVDKLAPEDTASGSFKVTLWVNEDRRLSLTLLVSQSDQRKKKTRKFTSKL
jgi:hypothetical protein